MPSFESLFLEVRSISMYEAWRTRILYEMCQRVENIPGDVVELGVFRGGSARIIARCLPKKTIHLFDTFDGMPPIWRVDLGETFFEQHPEHRFKEKNLEKNVKKFLSDCPNVVLHTGVFPATVAKLAKKEFALFHFDADLYQSCKDGLEFVYPRMNSGGGVVIDDYGRGNCPGVKIATDEFLKGKPEILMRDYEAPFQMVWFQKGIEPLPIRLDAVGLSGLDQKYPVQNMSLEDYLAKK